MRDNPRWFPLQRHIHQAVPAWILPWLSDGSSLTARILEHCDGPFRVELIHQWRGKPMAGEAQFLGIKPGRVALIREVRLHCSDSPWVYARSVIPLDTLNGPGRKLGNLGVKPLGAVLFADRRIKRDRMELARVRPGDLIFEHALGKDNRGEDHKGVEELWGRRSLFRVQQAPLLVSEWFLPAIPVFSVPHHPA